VPNSLEFFWYQDCFPFGYTVFGYKVASNVISALSLRRVIDEVLLGLGRIVALYHHSSTLYLIQ
jgi:hypothetical protein